MWKRLLLIALIAWGAHTWWTQRAATHGPGIVAAAVPAQDPIGEGVAFEFRGYRLTPLADFSVEARVLSRENYRLGRESELSPTDFALGWGRMSDEAVLTNIEISQSNRFFFWRVQEFPIPQNEIETSATNVHLIPADRTVEKQLDDVRRGQVVHLRGYLVRADASDGWHWVSSLSRDDRGAGACELLYVREVQTTL
ncbi:MAG: hypothetical protein ABW049_06730 [Spongiibacteraceae bacterium]